MKHELTFVTDLFEISFITEDLYSDNSTNIQCDKAQFLKQHKTRFETLFLEQGKTIKAICLNRK